MNGNYTILILSRNPAQSEFLESVLKQAGFRVLTVDADTELSFPHADARREEPDLILCDATPALSAEESLQNYRSLIAAYSDKLSFIPLLVLVDSAAAASSDKAETGEKNIFGEIQTAGAEVIAAPVQPPRLAATAARLIEHSRLSGALKKAEEKYSVLAENANDIIFTVDLDAVFLSLNRAAERISGYPREELVGSHFSKVIAPEYWDLVLRKMREKIAAGAAAGDEVTVYEAEILTKGDGRRVMLEINSRPIEKDGVPVGILGIARDITYRLEAERALRESEERLKAQYKAIPIPTMTWKRAAADDEGADDFVLVDFNDAADELSRGGIGALLGGRASRFFDHAPQMVEDLRRCFHARSIVKRETFAPILYVMTYANFEDAIAIGPGDRINLTPLWFGWARGNIYFYCRGQKVVNLRRDPVATVLVDRNERFPELQGA